jgi:transcription antitermination factor NusG
MLDATPHTRLDAAEPDPLHARNVGPRCGNWGVCYTQPQAEHFAEANLTRNGFRTYLPLATRWIKRPVHFVRVPLFARYLFVQHDIPELWRPIRETPGVTAVLQCGNRMQYASAGAVEALQAAEALAATQPPETASWAPGTPCSLATGPFAELDAVVLSIHRNIASVGIMCMGALRSVSVDVACLVGRE